MPPNLNPGIVTFSDSITAAARDPFCPGISLPEARVNLEPYKNAAIHSDSLAGDIACLVRRQESGDIGDI